MGCPGGNFRLFLLHLPVRPSVGVLAGLHDLPCQAGRMSQAHASGPESRFHLKNRDCAFAGPFYNGVNQKLFMAHVGRGNILKVVKNMLDRVSLAWNLVMCASAMKKWQIMEF